MQMVEYVLQPRDPKRHVGTPDHFVTEHPLVTSWCQQLADPAAASHATQVSPLPCLFSQALSRTLGGSVSTRPQP
jgi:hypothetical protein